MSLHLDLDEEQIAALQFLPDALHPNLKCLVPVLDSIRKTYTDVIPPHRRALPVNTTILHDQKRILTFSQSRQATDFKHTIAAAQALAIDYKEDDISVGNRGVGNLRLIGLVGLGPASRVLPARS
jgi:hypothetical protein